MDDVWAEGKTISNLISKTLLSLNPTEKKQSWPVKAKCIQQ